MTHNGNEITSRDETSSNYVRKIAMSLKYRAFITTIISHEHLKKSSIKRLMILFSTTVLFNCNSRYN